MILETASRNAMIEALGDLCDNGYLELRTAGDNEVAKCALSATAFGAAVNGAITANTITDDSDATGGTIDHAVLLKSDDLTVVATLTVTTVGGGGDVEVTSLVVAAGEKQEITSLVLTQPSGE